MGNVRAATAPSPTPTPNPNPSPSPNQLHSEPYRLWTLDVYDYELDSPMALYGGVPLARVRVRVRA